MRLALRSMVLGFMPTSLLLSGQGDEAKGRCFSEAVAVSKENRRAGARDRFGPYSVRGRCGHFIEFNLLSDMTETEMDAVMKCIRSLRCVHCIEADRPMATAEAKSLDGDGGEPLLA